MLDLFPMTHHVEAVTRFVAAATDRVGRLAHDACCNRSCPTTSRGAVADGAAGRRPRVDDLLQPRPAVAGQRRGARPLPGAIRARGAVPAVTAVLDGVARVGLDADEHAAILGPARKVAERDLAVAVAQQWAFGATTVSASVALAAAVGHRGVRHRRDRRRAPRGRADRRRQRRSRCAGPPPGRHRVRRGEGVPRPAAHARVPRDGRCSGARLAARLVPGVLHALVGAAACRIGSSRRPRWRRCCAIAPGERSGVLVGVPIPEADELDPAELDAVLDGRARRL